MRLRTKKEGNVVSQLYDEVRDFLHREAFLIDNRRFGEWLDLLGETLVYRMPLRVTREKSAGSDIVEEMTFLEENKRSLITRVHRLNTTSAWAEDPPSRTRHFITNIFVEPVADDEVQVTSYFLMLRSRGSKEEVEQIFGERHDVLKKVDSSWKLTYRTIYPDQSVLGIRNISNFL
ncbi:aromatic-ring-hydroxylating dioxygenase subunit beta [Alicyclobacillus dauci]|uniref:Aromatic-ring-hydroxylating dioxygenase subunit beta n=1 Tax=Alicyclobacillus dauci TaxID=1475485 RepID=A0ABY6YYJ4_9BACL|nr:aromatic-ring-hydroxylating dioxygenase subunit beta [Alicyclobacillus dauci]WAH35693.1 aromatic-ring-hydroxylating dioxygenase subunit beta [Alicyclobacillus dauci]